MDNIYFITSLIFKDIEIHETNTVKLELRNGEKLIGRIEESPFGTELFLIRQVRNLDLDSGDSIKEQPEAIEFAEIENIEIIS